MQEEEQQQDEMIQQMVEESARQEQMRALPPFSIGSEPLLYGENVTIPHIRLPDATSEMRQRWTLTEAQRPSTARARIRAEQMVEDSRREPDNRQECYYPDCRFSLIEHPESFIYTRDRGLMCMEHFNENAGADCSSCNSVYHHGVRVGYSNRQFCQHCASLLGLISCNDCGRLFVHSDPDWTSGTDNRCRRCVRRRERGERHDIFYRKFRIEQDFLKKTKIGNILQSHRAVGVELEVQWEEGEKAIDASHAILKEIGIGRDSSISGNGMELQTPPARGERAEVMIKKLCGQLLKYKFKTDKSCGMHVHVDVGDLDAYGIGAFRILQMIWCIYLTFEDVIMSFLPPSRRGNSYCQSLKADYHFDEVWKCQNMEALERLWYRVINASQINAAKGEHRHKSRYRGINLHPLFASRHLEIRYHSGTMISRKILEWANLHCKIVDWCMKGNLPSKDFFSTDRENRHGDNWLNRPPYGEKTEYFFDLIGLSEESRGYFRARQATFFEPLRVKEDESFKSGMNELRIEKEQ